MKKPWAGRFRGKTAKSVESFTESVSFDRRLWKHDIQGSIAHARMLGRQGIIRKSEASAIVRGLRSIAADMASGTFVLREELEDIHMNIEAELVKRIGPAGGKLHTARSRNDQVALDLRLYLREETGEVLSLIAALERSLLLAAERNISLILPGYTHLQRAQPVLLAHHLLAHVEMLERDRERFRDSLKRVNVLPLGSGALGGTRLPVDRKYVAEQLGFRAVSANSMDAVSDRDFALEFVFAAGVLMTHLGRLSEELVLWSSEEFSFITLPDAYATGSSIMPQKKNPDVPELVRGKTGRVYGNLMSLFTLMKGLPLAYNRDMQEDKPPVFDTVDTLKGCLTVLAEMIPRITFNEERMYEAASRSYTTATDIAEYLVRKSLPFREAHEVTGRIVAYAMEKRKGLEELTLEELRRFSKLIRKDVARVLDVKASAASRTSAGGTAPSEVRKALRRLKARLAK
jgi:argininosuccinate lyase